MIIIQHYVASDMPAPDVLVLGLASAPMLAIR
jgi:hypothetical protein